ncbi:hypothetical protein ACFL2T_05000 [Elusimicrobiota bacterium]
MKLPIALAVALLFAALPVHAGNDVVEFLIKAVTGDDAPEIKGGPVRLTDEEAEKRPRPTLSGAKAYCKKHKKLFLGIFFGDRYAAKEHLRAHADPERKGEIIAYAYYGQVEVPTGEPEKVSIMFPDGLPLYKTRIVEEKGDKVTIALRNDGRMDVPREWIAMIHPAPTRKEDRLFSRRYDHNAEYDWKFACYDPPPKIKEKTAPYSGAGRELRDGCTAWEVAAIVPFRAWYDSTGVGFGSVQCYHRRIYTAEKKSRWELTEEIARRDVSPTKWSCRKIELGTPIPEVNLTLFDFFDRPRGGDSPWDWCELHPPPSLPCPR